MATIRCGVTLGTVVCSPSQDLDRQPVDRPRSNLRLFDANRKANDRLSHGHHDRRLRRERVMRPRVTELRKKALHEDRGTWSSALALALVLGSWPKSLGEGDRADS
eukprot:scaffold7367_cov270-Pinguiococcus_pyrenoidosus.AAC.5